MNSEDTLKSCIAQNCNFNYDEALFTYFSDDLSRDIPSLKLLEIFPSFIILIFSRTNK